MTNRTRGQERSEEIDVSPTALVAEIEQLRGELEAAQRQADEYLVLLQRERAEFNNFRRRTAEERERELGLAGEDLIRKVLGIADDFDRAIDARPGDLAGHAWAEGVTAIDRKLRALLESEGVTAVDAAPGKRFDPREHEAIANVPGTERRDGEIVEEVRRGYRLRDRVLRPALVAVAQGGEPAASSAPAPAHTAAAGAAHDGAAPTNGPGRRHSATPAGPPPHTDAGEARTTTANPDHEPLND